MVEQQSHTTTFTLAYLLISDITVKHIVEGELVIFDVLCQVHLLSEIISLLDFLDDKRPLSLHLDDVMFFLRFLLVVDGSLPHDDPDLGQIFD